jgi:hypothetical protein
MSANANVDAFMMQLGEYLVVEFSKVPNAAYVYKANELPFEPYNREYSGTSADLKAGNQHGCAARFTHQHGWEANACRELRRLGILPDEIPGTEQGDGTVGLKKAVADDAPLGGGQRRSSRPSAHDVLEFDLRFQRPKGADFDMSDLRGLVSRYKGARLVDRRTTAGGRLWVEDPEQRELLACALKVFRFKWAESRKAWYYPET